MNKTNYSSGFTLLELLITVAITAIIMAMAAPNFADLIDDNVTVTQTNYFATAINVARSEAVKRNNNVIICKRSGNVCSTSTTTDWEAGWIVFADADADNQVDSGEEISIIDALRTGYTLRPSDVNTAWLSFTASGKASSNVAGTFTGIDFSMCSPDKDTTNARTININTVGRTKISKGVTACP